MPPKRKVPLFLKEHYQVLGEMVDNDQIKAAKHYLYNLPPTIYDAIIERATRGYCFETIVNKIEGLATSKNRNDVFKINNYDGDNNYLF